MTEWWKSFQDKLGKPSTEPKTLTFREQMAQEQDRQRKLDARPGAKRGPRGSTLKAGETPNEAKVEDMRQLVALLNWKLGLNVEPAQVGDNPSKVDGYWFGVKRYWQFGRAEGEEDKLSWKLHYYRSCANCKALVPTIELGDYLEIAAAAQKQMEGKEATVPKSTARLAAYLNDIEAGRPDAHCPRMCPNCRKLIKGGTL